MDAAGLLLNERVELYNVETGIGFATYPSRRPRDLAMYAARKIEKAQVTELFERPLHCTRADSLPGCPGGRRTSRERAS
ncbi:hypothetical protein XH98_20590 [Bradyrhizobium sp. CCBAU 51745]|nr:hypothetical protein [Bradyrhizobium sp. CCBAU 51745]